MRFSSKVSRDSLQRTKAIIGAFPDIRWACCRHMFVVQELDTLIVFDEKLWLTIIGTVTIQADGRMTFKFQGGTEITI